MAAWIKMPLGMELGLDPGDFVLDGDPAPAVQTDGYVAAESGPSCLCLYDARLVPTILGRRHGSKWLDAFPCGPTLSYVLRCGPT